MGAQRDEARDRLRVATEELRHGRRGLLTGARSDVRHLGRARGQVRRGLGDEHRALR